jgi:catechol 2,3-dioxygenase-like lactoylglutathione lyase family enzyme
VRCDDDDVLDHLGIQAADPDASLTFYTTVFRPLGFHVAMRIETPGGPVIGLAGPDGPPAFWLSPSAGGPAREDHIAFRASSRAEVDAVHTAAVDAGAEVLHAPREWPEYHDGYYAVFLRDPDGHNVEAVTHA